MRAQVFEVVKCDMLLLMSEDTFVEVPIFLDFAIPFKGLQTILSNSDLVIDCLLSKKARMESKERFSPILLLLLLLNVSEKLSVFHGCMQQLPHSNVIANEVEVQTCSLSCLVQPDNWRSCFNLFEVATKG